MKKKLYCLVILIIFSTISYAQKHSLKRKKIQSLELAINPNSLVFPGATFEIGILAATSNSIYNSKGFLNGNIHWSNYYVEVQGGRFSRGKVIVDRELDLDKHKSIVINIKPKHHQDLLLSQIIDLNYLVNIAISPLGIYSKAPGGHIPVQILGEFDNGMLLDLTHQKMPLNSLAIEVQGGKFIKNKICINEDPYSIINHTVHFWVQSNLYPAAKDSLAILLDYKTHYTLNLSGSSGSSGRNGMNGFSGSLHEHGDDGENGYHGDHGYHGKDAEVNVESYVHPVIGELVLVGIFELNGEKSWNYIINPDGGSLKIKSNGGDGGSGGLGGNGGNGGSGMNGEKLVKRIQVNDSTFVEEIIYTAGTNGGDGGYGGHGGDGGWGGNGGNITIKFSENALQFMNIIHAQSLPGSGGSGGFGGMGGSGGSGGTGFPNGCSGRSGYSGSNGNSGYSGERGKVRIMEMSPHFSKVDKLKK